MEVGFLQSINNHTTLFDKNEVLTAALLFFGQL